MIDDWVLLIFTGLFLGIGVAITSAIMFGFGLIFLKMIVNIEYRLSRTKDRFFKMKKKMQEIKEKIDNESNYSDPTA
ncbi:MAG: hypothetical protein WAX79_01805 [Candidatus Omnitrophota bacterium]